MAPTRIIEWVLIESMNATDIKNSCKNSTDIIDVGNPMLTNERAETFTRTHKHIYTHIHTSKYIHIPEIDAFKPLSINKLCEPNMQAIFIRIPYPYSYSSTFTFASLNRYYWTLGFLMLAAGILLFICIYLSNWLCFIYISKAEWVWRRWKSES